MLIVYKFTSKVILFQEALLFQKAIFFVTINKLQFNFLAKFHLLLLDIFLKTIVDLFV